MKFAKYKVINAKDKILHEENHEEFQPFNYDAYLNTRILDLENSNDILKNSIMENQFSVPSKFDIDYSTAKYEIRLSADAWNRIADIEGQPVNKSAIESFQKRIKKFYA